MNTNTETSQLSLVSQGRELLERGDISSAVACYGKVFDPESTDETEARNMLIEGRSNLARKFLPEALDCFEEALLMGSEIQRRQALDGISSIGHIRSQHGVLIQKLKQGLKRLLGKQREQSIGISMVSDDENIVLLADEAFEHLPPKLAKGSRITRIPARLAEVSVPFKSSRCIAYTTEDDVSFILELANSLIGERNLPNSGRYVQSNH